MKHSHPLRIATAVTLLCSLATAAIPAHATEPFFNTAPVAQAGGPYTIHLGESLLVNGSTSFDPDAALVGDFITDYRWDLGADGLYEGFGVSDTFTALELANAGINDIGIFTLRLAVTDTFGGVGSQTISFEVLPPASTAVPEPGSLSLFGLGLGLAGAISFRRRGK